MQAVRRRSLTVIASQPVYKDRATVHMYMQAVQGSSLPACRAHFCLFVAVRHPHTRRCNLFIKISHSKYVINVNFITEVPIASVRANKNIYFTTVTDIVFFFARFTTVTRLKYVSLAKRRSSSGQVSHAESAL